MKFLGLILVSVLFSGQVFAAKFVSISNVKSLTSQKLARAAAVIINNESVFGDAGSISAFSYVQKSTELTGTMIKQLSFAKGGATTDDTQVDFSNQSVGKIVDFALYAVENQETEDEPAFKTAQVQLAMALKNIQADPNLKIFGSGHADEDGSWQILYVVDTTSKQILMVKIGYFGT